ncbi:MAG: phosphoribosylanthranilate isomerase [Thermincola sp.]|jgi:phosphoribosylanthranilate isomerase|nr:phosphoribosylanthranilate isomerase [Thermincola sp.]MDT3703748.1 phosphoribosylanthranilate isomerase [Thermincola sp.]
MLIKICGLREADHALLTAELGADLLGFVFADSPRQIAPESAREIIARLPSAVGKVGVFVDCDLGVINDIISFCGLDFAQLHGKETPEYCLAVQAPVIKAWRIKDEESLTELLPYRDCVEMFLLDTYVKGAVGGTGQTFDWSLAGQAAEYGKIILAGGLTPENVALAVETVGPYGVDVSSGVETAGAKDMAKIAAFIKQARGRKYA